MLGGQIVALGVELGGIDGRLGCGDVGEVVGGVVGCVAGDVLLQRKLRDCCGLKKKNKESKSKTFESLRICTQLEATCTFSNMYLLCLATLSFILLFLCGGSFSPLGLFEGGNVIQILVVAGYDEIIEACVGL